MASQPQTQVEQVAQLRMSRESFSLVVKGLSEGARALADAEDFEGAILGINRTNVICSRVYLGLATQEKRELLSYFTKMQGTIDDAASYVVRKRGEAQR
ncbi:hypothetical protein J4233_06155 [Candidatus Pacearchaeota archaeon]|nr:hypothetical protein [Candidatus Pacearchaeota archaeon]